MFNDFEKFAMSQGIGTNKLNSFQKLNNRVIEPYVLEERELNCQPMSVFSRLMYDRIIFIGTAIDDDVANIINAQLLYLNSTGSEDISLFINSPGGSVIDGLSIYDIMNFVKPDVATYCVGMCASMAGVLLSSGAKGKRYSLPNGEIMLHQLSGGSYGMYADMKIAVEHASRLHEKLIKILAENTNKDTETIRKDIDRDNWFDAENALNYSLIDKIIKTAK